MEREVIAGVSLAFWVGRGCRSALYLFSWEI